MKIPQPSSEPIDTAGSASFEILSEPIPEPETQTTSTEPAPQPSKAPKSPNFFRTYIHKYQQHCSAFFHRHRASYLRLSVVALSLCMVSTTVVLIKKSRSKKQTHTPTLASFSSTFLIPSESSESTNFSAPRRSPYRTNQPSHHEQPDLTSIRVDEQGAYTQTSAGNIARLTIDPRLQDSTLRILTKYKVNQAAVVALEPSSGRILAYASRDREGRDLITSAFAPSASIFKVVTGAALVQSAGVSPDQKVCFSGGEQRIHTSNLQENPQRDRHCATLGQAMGRSINTIFGRLALKYLSSNQLETIATRFGYGSSIPFDTPVEISKLDIPQDSLEFARTAAGFYHTTLSPLHGALIAGSIANHGVMMRPYIIQEITNGHQTLWHAQAPQAFEHAIEPSTASAMTRMMLETTTQGTSYKAFHDGQGNSFLPGIQVAGKTGTLNLNSSPHNGPTKLVTWFIGFAPAQSPKIALATFVVNDPAWKLKANVLARQVLQAYFGTHRTKRMASLISTLPIQ